MSSFFVDDFINLLIVDISRDDYDRICRKSEGIIYVELELILQHGVSLEQRIRALELAVKNEFGGGVRLLVNHGTSSPDILTNVLIHTSITGNTKILKFLCDNGANLQVHAKYLLNEGAYLGHLSFVKYLLDHNGKSYLNDVQSPPLIMAVERDHLPMVKLLYKRGANLSICNSGALLLSAKNDCMGIVTYLLRKKININTYNPIGSNEEKKFGISALINSCGAGNLAMSKYLLNNGADCYICDQMALAKSITNNHIKITKLLLKHGSDPNSIFIHNDVINEVSLS